MADTLACVVSSTGITAPAYEEILTYLQGLYTSLYGPDIYIAADSQDGQLIAAFAKLIKDCNDATIATYNSFSPATAQGVGLSSIVKINGIRRLVPSNSTVVVAIGGTNGTQIVNGYILDASNNIWNLPAIVNIPGSGTINVTATARDAGAIQAAPHSFIIGTPTRGWQTADNALAAVPGAPTESDSALRIRQSVSTSIPALSVIDAILGAILNITDVNRATIYENFTDATDANGVPEHSISAVVEGGDVNVIAETIYLYKTPGTGTYGTTVIAVTDQKGLTKNISFFVLAVTDVKFIVNIKALTGYVSTTATAIQQAVAYWMSNLAIGQDSLLNKLWSPVNLTGDSATSATGQTQLQLDVLSTTYDPTSIYQARSDMNVTGGPYAAGSTVINVGNIARYLNGDKVAMVLDNGSYFYTSVNGVPAAGHIVLLNAIPALRSLANGNLIYVADDIVVAFNEATQSVAADVTVIVS